MPWITELVVESPSRLTNEKDGLAQPSCATHVRNSDIQVTPRAQALPMYPQATSHRFREYEALLGRRSVTEIAGIVRDAEKETVRWFEAQS
jgi:hypothetical protein